MKDCVPLARLRGLTRKAAAKSFARFAIALSCLFFFCGCGSPPMTASSRDDRQGPARPSTYTSLDGIYRGDLGRTGTYPVTGVASPRGVFWQFTASLALLTSPVVGDNAVYVVANDGYLHQLDARTGTEIWRTSAGPAPVLVSEGILYYSDHGNLYAVDSKSRQQRWVFKTDSDIQSAPAIQDGMLYFGNDNGYVFAVDTATGQEKWRIMAGVLVDSEIAIADGLVYFIGSDKDARVGSDVVYYNGRAYAVDSKTGQRQWSFSGGGNVTGLAVRAGIVYCVDARGTVDVNGVSSGELVYMLNNKTGREVGRFDAAGTVGANPVVTTETLYIGTQSGTLSAVDLQTKLERWRLSLGAWVGEMAYANGIVYFSCADGFLHAVDAKTGQEKWKLPQQEGVRMSPVIGNDVVFFADSHHVYAVH